MNLPDKKESDNKLPPALLKRVDESKIDYMPLRQMAFEKRKVVTRNEVFPTNLTPRVVQKLVLATETIRHVAWINGEADKYVEVVAFALNMDYEDKVLTTRPERALEEQLKGNELKVNTYTAIFPIRAWDNMFLRAVGQSFGELAPRVLEVHFRKMTHKNYELQFLAEVEWNNDQFKFDRKIIEYRALKYNENRRSK
jgi:hypothetical protein